MRGRIVRKRRHPRAKGTRGPVAIPLLAPRAGEHRLQRALARQRPRGCRLFERPHRLGPLTRRGGHLPEPPRRPDRTPGCWSARRAARYERRPPVLPWQVPPREPAARARPADRHGWPQRTAPPPGSGRPMPDGQGRARDAPRTWATGADPRSRAVRSRQPNRRRATRRPPPAGQANVPAAATNGSARAATRSAATASS